MSRRQVEIYAVADVVAPELQLHVRAGTGASALLFGWSREPEPIDGGVPAAVVDIFAHALARNGPVAFLHAAVPAARDGVWQEVAGEQWLRLSPTLVQRVRGHRPVALVISRRAERLRELFSGDVSWSQQLQAGLLLREGAAPAISRAHIEALVTARDAAFSTLPVPAEAAALVLPAVDGDYIEMVASSAHVLASLRAAVATESTRRGVLFQERTDWR